MGWEDDQRERLRSGYYKPPPWGEMPWISASWNSPMFSAARRLHFPHVSRDEPAKLAYTRSAEHGEADRQTKTRPGKYLTKFYARLLAPEAIAEWAAAWGAAAAPPTLEIALTPDEIEAVYTSGPRSCMSHEVSQYDTNGVHPTRAYGAGDLGIAYVRNDAGDIQARCLCWPEKKLYRGFYGDPARLERVLQDDGYTRAEAGAFNGARLLRLPVPDAGDERLVAPYIDAYEVSLLGPDGAEHEDYIYVDARGSYSPGTQGVIRACPTFRCGRCEDQCDEDEGRSVGDEIWCESCVDNSSIWCSHCETAQPEDDYECVNDETWCRACADDDAFYCEECSASYPSDDEVYVESKGRSYCEDCAPPPCEHCDERVELVTTKAGEDLCADCATECNTCGDFYPSGDVEDGDCEECREDEEEAA